MLDGRDQTEDEQLRLEKQGAWRIIDSCRFIRYLVIVHPSIQSEGVIC